MRFRHFQFPLLFSLASALTATLSSCTDKNIRVSTITITPRLGELAMAVAAGSETEVQSLIARGASVNENIGSGSQPITPLMLALAYSQTPNDKMAAYLLEQGAYTDIAFKSKQAGVPSMTIRQWICLNTDTSNTAYRSLPKVPKSAARSLASGSNYNNGCIGAPLLQDRIQKRDDLERNSK